MTHTRETFAALTALLAAAVAPAAPVPKAIVFPLRTDPLPAEFKEDDLAATALPKGMKGTVTLLAWERVEDSRPHVVIQALVLTALAEPDADGVRFRLASLYRKPADDKWQRSSRTVSLPPPGKTLPPLSDAFISGEQGYSRRPTDKELAAFLKDVNWRPELGEKVVTTGRGKEVSVTKLGGGGVNRNGWKKTFDRDPPTDLFPELKTQEK